MEYDPTMWAHMCKNRMQLNKRKVHIFYKVKIIFLAARQIKKCVRVYAGFHALRMTARSKQPSFHERHTSLRAERKGYLKEVQIIELTVSV